MINIDCGGGDDPYWVVEMENDEELCLDDHLLFYVNGEEHVITLEKLLEHLGHFDGEGDLP